MKCYLFCQTDGVNIRPQKRIILAVAFIKLKSPSKGTEAYLQGYWGAVAFIKPKSSSKATEAYYKDTEAQFCLLNQKHQVKILRHSSVYETKIT